MNLYDTKIEDSEKAGSCWELHPGHLCGGRLPATAGLFTFLYFCLIISKFIYLIPVANTSTQDTPWYSCKWSGYLGILGYSDKGVQYACVHASTVLGSWDTLPSRGCSMHVFMPVRPGMVRVFQDLWPGMVQLIYHWISMPFDGVTGHPSASIGPSLNGNLLDSPCVFINEGNKPCYYGNGYQDFAGYIPSYFCTQCKVILTNTIWQQLNLLQIHLDHSTTYAEAIVSLTMTLVMWTERTM